MSIFKQINKLSWKNIIGINLSLFILGGMALSVMVIKTPTSTAPKATFTEPAKLIPNYPIQPPTISALELFFGKSGDTVRLKGSNFGTHQWDSTINSIPSQNIISWSDSIIDFVIPEKLNSGVITLAVNGKAATSPYPLIVYKSSSDPELVINNNQISIIRAPIDSTLTYKLTSESSLHTISITQNSQIISNNYDLQSTIEFASLKSKQGDLLPLFISPENLL